VVCGESGRSAGWCLWPGATLRLWSTLYIGGRKRVVLVSDGPYSLCRNPLYVGTFLIALSNAEQDSHRLTDRGGRRK
jgi:protein-S-isoprenylcysteine O-methyltransferase Ste14